MSVVPDRGSPTMNTGISLSSPKPRTRPKKSGVQAAIIRLTKDSCSCGSYSRPRRAIGQLQGVARGGAGRPRRTRPARPGRGPVRSATTCLLRPSAPLARRRQNPAAVTAAAQPGPLQEVCRPGVRPICNARRRTADCAATQRRTTLPPPRDRPAPLSAAQVAVGLGIVGLQFQGPAVAGDRFSEIPLILETAPQTAVRLGSSGFNCTARADGQGSSSFPCSRKALPRLTWASAQSGRAVRARTYVLHGELAIAALGVDDAQQMPGVGLRGLGRENPPIDLSAACKRPA